MDVHAFLERIQRQPFFAEQICHIEHVVARPPVYSEVTGGMHPKIDAVLQSAGIHKLYCHQADAVNKIRQGHNVVVVTGTASGKTLCYTIPILEEVIENPLSTMLLLFPTKALTQDQLRNFTKFGAKETGIEFLAGAYDGDTPGALRRKLRDNGQVILTNPDMLHQGILPQHGRWSRFFTHLKYIVIDEVHAYRGIFGSNLANVIRRVKRICNHYGSNPQFICCSATIANPASHASGLCGTEMELVANDGSPKGTKHFVLWNPPPFDVAARKNSSSWRSGGERKSSMWEAVQLLTALVEEEVQTIAFVRTRLAAELVLKHTRDLLRPKSNRLADAVYAYRGGYLPEERRAIEKKLANREILGVASTNALELGIDIGTLDVCIVVGYPGSIASLWQQAGRAGRAQSDSLVFLVGQNSPIDQYLMIHSDYLFRQSPEQAIIDPDNPHIVIGHLKCAAQELPLGQADMDLFGVYAEPLQQLLEEDQFIRKYGVRWYWASTVNPASEVQLRNIAGPVYTIQDEADNCRVIGTVDEISALSQLHDHAVYLHGAETYFVNKLDLEQKIARVEKRDLDYYTRSVQSSQIRVDATDEKNSWCGASLSFGDVTVTTSTEMFKKIKFLSRDSLGFEKLELPQQSLETVALWFTPPKHITDELLSHKLIAAEALIGIANVFVDVAPLFIMCDSNDIGTVVDSGCLNQDTLFVHDRYPGGMGYAKRCMENFSEIAQTIYKVIKGCGCLDGCPSCVGSPITPSSMTDIDCSVRGRIPDKAAALLLLEMLFNAVPSLQDG